jgi:hypothetical protein
MPSRIDVRITDELKQNITKFSQENDVKMPELLREILELGLKEKQKQQENIKTKQPQWDEYYKHIASRNDVSMHMILELARMLSPSENEFENMKNTAKKKALDYQNKIIHNR